MSAAATVRNVALAFAGMLTFYIWFVCVMEVARGTNWPTFWVASAPVRVALIVALVAHLCTKRER